MTHAHPTIPAADRARLRSAKEALRRPGSFGFVALPGAAGAVFRSERGVAKALCPLTLDDAERLCRDGVLREVSRSDRGIRYGAVARSDVRMTRSRRPGDEGHTAPDRRNRKFLEAEKFFSMPGEKDPISMTVNLGESPLGWLSKRKDARGRPFLLPEEVAAGERLRADFERAQLGPSVTQDWRRFLTAGIEETRGADATAAQPEGGAAAARKRVLDAIRELGPGLGDAAFRTCCFLEGLEQVERQMEWSARSGKVVLKLALGRLALHYERCDRPKDRKKTISWHVEQA